MTALALQRALTRVGHTVVACATAVAEAMAAVQAYRPDAVLLDVHLLGPANGLLAGLDIQTLWSTPVIYLSGSTPAQLDIPEFPEALWCFLSKPVDMTQLCAMLAWLFPGQHAGTREELREQLRQRRRGAVPLTV